MKEEEASKDKEMKERTRVKLSTLRYATFPFSLGKEERVEA